MSFMELGYLLTRSGLTYPEVSSKVYHYSFYQLRNSISLPWVIYFKAFYLHVVSSFSCIPVICPKLVLFLTPLQFIHLFCNVNLKWCLNCVCEFHNSAFTVLFPYLIRGKCRKMCCYNDINNQLDATITIY